MTRLSASPLVSFLAQPNALEIIRQERRRRRFVADAAARGLSFAHHKELSLWSPQVGPQTEAYLSPAYETLYGGQAGGGKSDLALGLACTAHRKSIFFRREYGQLIDAIERSKEILRDTPASFNGQRNVWRHIPGGRVLEFGAVQYEDDKNAWKGRPHDLKAFDELSEFTESQYLFLTGWARTTIPSQRVRIIGMSNPPAHAEGEWVIRRWAAWLDKQHAHPAVPGELRWYVNVDGKEEEREDGTPFTWKDETLYPASRTFIPASLNDNAFLRDSTYRQTLQNLPEPLRSQLLYGDFAIGRDDDPWQLIPTDWVRQAQARWEQHPQPTLALSAIGMDVARGGKDQTVISKRYGNWYAPLKKYAGTQTPDGPTAAGLGLMELSGDAVLNIDVIGIGSSAYDFAKLSAGDKAKPINFGAKSDRIDRTGKFAFVNIRAEAYWTLREALDPMHGDNVALPPDQELLADLTAPIWELRSGRIKVEDKDEIKKRLGRSPDAGDAIALASFEPQEVDLW